MKHSVLCLLLIAAVSAANLKYNPHPYFNEETYNINWDDLDAEEVEYVDPNESPYRNPPFPEPAPERPSVPHNTILDPLTGQVKYEPTWPSLDSRPLPKWYDEAKVGVFIHWGVFSVPSFHTEWFWYRWQHDQKKEFINFMKDNYKPGFTYADFAPQFTAEFYDANQWADILKASGAQYVVFVSKHHEGYTNWPSKNSFNWNSMDVGPGRDLLGELATAIRNRTDIHFGVYHSLLEWFNPLYLYDQKNHYKTSRFVDEKTMPELYDLVNTYKPDVIWSDGDWGTTDEYWKSKEFLAWLYNESPVKDSVVVNDRWGENARCKHGDTYTCHDRYNPGHLLKHKWENCMTVQRGSWGYNRQSSLSSFLKLEDLTTLLAETVSCGGNLLMNIGPTHDGRILPVFEERLRQFGDWMKVNGEAIYASKPWTYQNDTSAANVWYTSKVEGSAKNVYAILLSWPAPGTLHLGAPTPSDSTTVSLLGYKGNSFKWAKSTKGMDISIPAIPFNQMPCEAAWVLKITGLQ